MHEFVRIKCSSGHFYEHGKSCDAKNKISSKLYAHGKNAIVDTCIWKKENVVFLAEWFFIDRLSCQKKSTSNCLLVLFLLLLRCFESLQPTIYDVALKHSLHICKYSLWVIIWSPNNYFQHLQFNQSNPAFKKGMLTLICCKWRNVNAFSVWNIGHILSTTAEKLWQFLKLFSP